MTDSRRTSYVVLVAAVVVCIFAYARFFTPVRRPVPIVYDKPIVIGTETWPGYLPLYVARDLGYFADEGVRVEIKRYVSLKELSEDYVAGKMQGRANLTLDAIREASRGVDHRIVAVIDHSNGADAILAHPSISEIGMLKGKKVAFEPGTLEEFFLSWVLAQVDLSLNDVTAVAGDPLASAERLRNGEVDAAVTHEPYITDLGGSGDHRVLFSSSEAHSLITDVLTFRKAFADEHRDAVEAVVRAYFRGVEYWKEHPAEAEALLAKEFGTEPGSIAVQMRGIVMLDAEENHKVMSSEAGKDSLFEHMRSVGVFISRHEGIDPVATDAMIDPRYLPSTR